MFGDVEFPYAGTACGLLIRRFQASSRDLSKESGGTGTSRGGNKGTSGRARVQRE